MMRCMVRRVLRVGGGRGRRHRGQTHGQEAVQRMFESNFHGFSDGWDGTIRSVDGVIVGAAHGARHDRCPAIVVRSCNRFPGRPPVLTENPGRSEEHTSALQSLMRISYAVFCLKNKKYTSKHSDTNVK